MEKSSTVILLCYRNKRCGVIESIESQYEIFCELGVLPKTIYWSQLSFRELLCLRRSPNIIFISHDLRSDLLLVLFNLINKLKFFRRPRQKFVLFSHSEYLRDYPNRKGTIYGQLLAYTQSILYNTDCLIASPSLPHANFLSALHMKPILVLPHDSVPLRSFLSHKVARRVEPISSPDKTIKFLISDSFDENKCIKDCLRLLSSLQHSIPMMHIKILGCSTHDQQEQLKSIINSSELSFKTVLDFDFYDTYKPMLDAYSSSNIFITMSASESFHYSIFYAFAIGVPIICSDIPVHRWLSSYFPFTPVYFIDHKFFNTVDFHYSKKIEYFIKNTTSNPQSYISYQQYGHHIRQYYRNFLLDIFNS